MSSSSKPFNRNTATRYALVHREQADRLAADPDAPSQILNQISGPYASSSSRSLDPQLISYSSKVKHRHDLDLEFAKPGAVRDNEGEAAEHGVFFDDTKYDYMQHLRDLGSATGDAAWVEAPATREAKSSGKGKQCLEDALRDIDLDGQAEPEVQSLGGSISFPRRDMISEPSPSHRSIYEKQQDVPDALRGFRPDLDPRLREVMEALDDEAYVDDEEDMFGVLTAEGGEELGLEEWEGAGLDADVTDEDGWESDDTTKPVYELKAPTLSTVLESNIPHSYMPDPHPAPPDTEPTQVVSETAVGSSKESTLPKPGSVAPSAAFTADTSLTGRRKKRKGALTSSTGMSMTSSALARTEPLNTLDSRFDRILDSYMDDIGEEDDEPVDDSISMMSEMTGLSRKTGMSSNSFAPLRAGGRSSVSTVGSSAGDKKPPFSSNVGLNSVLDDFLQTNGGGKKGRKMRKAGREGIWGQQNGISQLDEIRSGLGPARTHSSSGGLKA